MTEPNDLHDPRSPGDCSMNGDRESETEGTYWGKAYATNSLRRSGCTDPKFLAMGARFEKLNSVAGIRKAYAAELARLDPECTAFLTHGPLVALAYDRATPRELVLDLLVMTPPSAAHATVVLDVVREHILPEPRDDPKEWTVLRMALKAEPSLGKEMREHPVFARCVLDVLMSKDPSPPLLQEVGLTIEAASLHASIWFRSFGGVSNLMEAALQDMSILSDKTMIHLLDQARGFVIFAPSLLVWIEHAKTASTEVVRTLVARGGTDLMLRICREAPDARTADALLRRLHAKAGDALYALWPQRVHDALPRSTPAPPTAPTTSHECPITQEACVDPVVASDGHTYERDAILRYLLQRNTSPMTREVIHDLVVPNHDLQRACPAVAEAAADAPEPTPKCARLA